jgi:hypothetical protein
MKRLFGAMPTRWQRLHRFAAWGVLIVLVFASLPLLFDLMSRDRLDYRVVSPS